MKKMFLVRMTEFYGDMNIHFLFDENKEKDVKLMIDIFENPEKFSEDVFTELDANYFNADKVCDDTMDFLNYIKENMNVKVLSFKSKILKSR